MFLTPLFFCCCWVVGSRRTAGVLGCLQTRGLINSSIHKQSPLYKHTNSRTRQFINFPIYIRCSFPICYLCVKKHKKLALRFDIFLKKACVVFKKDLPLHPLSGTKFSGSDWKRVHWKIYIDSSSTRADVLVFMGWARLGRTLRTVGSPYSFIEDVG